MGALDGIGNTPLVELERIRPVSGARIVAKLEWANPTGSMKHRMGDAIEQVSADDAIAMHRLAREEGLLAGTTSGANVVAAPRVAERLGLSATVATVLCDFGLRYLSTVYKDG